MRSVVFVLLSVFMSATGQVLLKIGANRLGSLFVNRADISKDLIKIFSTPEVLAGICFFVAGFLLWIKVLTREELSYTYPMTSISYVIIVLYSYLIFKETLTVNKVLGMILIISGVIFINR